MSSEEFNQLILDVKPDRESFADVLESLDWKTTKEHALCFLEQWDELTADLTASRASDMIWAIISFPMFLGNESLSDIEEERLIAACERVTCSVPRLHPQGEPMETGFFMLWDLFITRAPSATKALERLTSHPDVRVQMAALHGLGHRGPERIPIIEKYLRRHPEMADDAWVQSCLDGSVM